MFDFSNCSLNYYSSAKFQYGQDTRRGESKKQEGFLFASFFFHLPQGDLDFGCWPWIPSCSSFPQLEHHVKKKRKKKKANKKT